MVLFSHTTAFSSVPSTLSVRRSVACSLPFFRGSFPWHRHTDQQSFWRWAIRRQMNLIPKRCSGPSYRYIRRLKRSPAVNRSNPSVSLRFRVFSGRGRACPCLVRCAVRLEEQRCTTTDVFVTTFYFPSNELLVSEHWISIIRRRSDLLRFSGALAPLLHTRNRGSESRFGPVFIKNI